MTRLVLYVAAPLRTGYQIEGASGRNEDRRTFEQWMLGYQESCTR